MSSLFSSPKQIIRGYNLFFRKSNKVGFWSQTRFMFKKIELCGVSSHKIIPFFWNCHYNNFVFPTVWLNNTAILFSHFSFLLTEQFVFCLFWWVVSSSLLIYYLVLVFQLTPLGRFLCDATKEPKRSKGEPFANP